MWIIVSIDAFCADDMIDGWSLARDVKLNLDTTTQTQDKFNFRNTRENRVSETMALSLWYFYTYSFWELRH